MHLFWDEEEGVWQTKGVYFHQLSNDFEEYHSNAIATVNCITFIKNMYYVFFQLNLLFELDSNATYYIICPTCCDHCIPCLMCFKVIYENVLFVEIMYYFNEQVISKFLQN